MGRETSIQIGAFAASLLLHAAAMLAVVAYTHRPDRTPPSPRQIQGGLTAGVDAELPAMESALFGESSGRGDANAQTPGEFPQAGKVWREVQAFLSRDPQGTGEPTRDADGLVRSATDGAFSTGSMLAGAGIVGQPAMADPAPQGGAVFGLRSERSRRLERDLESRSAAAEARPSPAADGTATSRRPADPAPQSASESDPFSTLSAVRFMPGRTEVRFGRAVKTVRPDFTLQAQLDLFAFAGVSWLVRADYDEQGRVTDVTFLRSGGSHALDNAVRLAVYQWEFEPRKGPDGRPQAGFDVFRIEVAR